MTSRSWTLVHVGQRPPTVNAERRLHPQRRAEVVREWRAAFAWLAVAERIPRLAVVEIVSWPLHASRRSPQDVGACLPGTKAAVDGLIDAGVLVDDGPAVVRSLTFRPPVIDGRDGLVLDVIDVSSVERDKDRPGALQDGRGNRKRGGHALREDESRYFVPSVRALEVTRSEPEDEHGGHERTDRADSRGDEARRFHSAERTA